LAATHPHAALAAAAGGGSLPWDAPLTNDITGPVAFTISLLAMVACGAALAFGGEIHEFARCRLPQARSRMPSARPNQRAAPQS
jgi:type IV secretory pathway VirB2 component (pilin)